MAVVLGCFSSVERRLSLARLADLTGLPKTTLHRILAALREIGFLEQDAGGGYALGLGLFQLGSLALANLDLHREAAPVIGRLMRASGEAVHLGVFDGARIVVVERRARPGDARVTITELEAAPAHCTGVGKAALAFQDAAVIERVIRNGLEPFTRSTITQPDALRRELKRIRARGYAVDDGEHTPGVRCVAAPIRDAAGRVFAALSITGPASRIAEARTAALAEMAIRAAAEIGRHLGAAKAAG
jgi:DNA-binding IclR family transcriptional regulator